MLEEKSKLDTELLKQIEFNKQLQESNSVKLGHTFEDRVSNSLNSLYRDVLSKNKNDCFLLFITIRAVTNTIGMQEAATPLYEISGRIIEIIFAYFQ